MPPEKIKKQNPLSVKGLDIPKLSKNLVKIDVGKNTALYFCVINQILRICLKDEDKRVIIMQGNYGSFDCG